MSMLEKFNEHKKAMHAKFDETHETFVKAMDEASNEFLDKFKSLVASASEDEFRKFIYENNDVLNDEDIMAAIVFRIEAKNENQSKSLVKVSTL